MSVQTKEKPIIDLKNVLQMILQESDDQANEKPVSPIGDGDTPLHLLIKILDGNI